MYCILKFYVNFFTVKLFASVFSICFIFFFSRFDQKDDDEGGKQRRIRGRLVEKQGANFSELKYASGPERWFVKQTINCFTLFHLYALSKKKKFVNKCFSS